LLSRCATIWAMPPVLFALVIFWTSFLILARGQSQTEIFLSKPAVYMGLQPCDTMASLFVEMGSC
jgi:hypothetical protein